MYTFRRRPYFESASNVEPVRDHLLQTAVARDIEIVAYCFMEDHLHALVSGTHENSDAMKFCDTFRQVSGFHYRRSNHVRLWQDGFYDHVLRDTDATFDVVSYIVANPVRAGLVADVSTYPFLGSSRYSLDEVATSVQWRPDGLG